MSGLLFNLAVLGVWFIVTVGLGVAALNAYMERGPWIWWTFAALMWLSAPLLAAVLA